MNYKIKNYIDNIYNNRGYYTCDLIKNAPLNTKINFVFDGGYAYVYHGEIVRNYKNRSLIYIY